MESALGGVQQNFILAAAWTACVASHCVHHQVVGLGPRECKSPLLPALNLTVLVHRARRHVGRGCIAASQYSACLGMQSMLLVVAEGRAVVASREPSGLYGGAPPLPSTYDMVL
mmetsp:Transcript_76161/g.191727  ORF Transcript_76161/g.191727 Transcript_76161/m.191727 type:complete len:114 (+) Transcript_76161:1349-1690(+)